MQKTNYWVAKFGGTSVATFEAMTRCASLLKMYPQVKVVIVSAQAGVTNLLVKLCETSDSAIQTLNEINHKIQVILTALPNEKHPQLSQEIKILCDELKKLAEISHKNKQQMDEILSYGERISARLFTAALTMQGLPAIHQDARKLIKTNTHFGKAEVDIVATKKAVTNILLPLCTHHIVVSEGFIGSSNNQEESTTTLGRGGSDYSAALIAEAMEAEVLQIWTDVSGIYTVDPNLVAHAKPIETMCFTEAAELATFGAKVLHPATLWPAIRKNIPVFVGSSMNVKAQGTWIRAELATDVNQPILRAIALRRKQSLLTINSLEMLYAHGFLAKIFTILARHELSIDLVTTSEVSVALTLDHSHHDLLSEDVLAELKSIGNVSLKVDKDLCLIALVGSHLQHLSGMSGQVFHVLRPFNIRLICYGASSHNLCFLTNENEADAVVRAIHAEFFEKQH